MSPISLSKNEQTEGRALGYTRIYSQPGIYFQMKIYYILKT